MSQSPAKSTLSPPKRALCRLGSVLLLAAGIVVLSFVVLRHAHVPLASERLRAWSLGVEVIQGRTALRQTADNDCGVVALLRVFEIRHVHVDRAMLERHMFLRRRGSTALDLATASVSVGLQAQVTSSDASEILSRHARLPMLLLVGSHWVVLEELRAPDSAIIFDPSIGCYEIRLADLVLGRKNAAVVFERRLAMARSGP